MSKNDGFTLLETLAVLLLVALLTSVAMPMFSSYADRARVSAAIGDISTISLAIERYRLKNGDWVPPNLGVLGIDIPDDPWGQPYQYLRLQDDVNRGAARKDGNLVPLNSDFDLYSVGADGSSVSSLRGQPSQDDIVRANNGAFIGLGKDY